MTAESATLQGRAAAAALMVDACRMERAAGTSGVDPVTGRNEPVWDLMYEGPCRFQMPAAVQRLRETPGRESTVQQFIVSLPVTEVGARVGDRVTATACRLDPDVVGRVFVVIALHHKSHITARRLTIEEVTG